jgi:hypothetical protein
MSSSLQQAPPAAFYLPFCGSTQAGLWTLGNTGVIKSICFLQLELITTPHYSQLHKFKTKKKAFWKQQDIIYATSNDGRIIIPWCLKYRSWCKDNQERNMWFSSKNARHFSYCNPLMIEARAQLQLANQYSRPILHEISSWTGSVS